MTSSTSEYAFLVILSPGGEIKRANREQHKRNNVMYVGGTRTTKHLGDHGRVALRNTSP